MSTCIIVLPRNTLYFFFITDELKNWKMLIFLNRHKNRLSWLTDWLKPTILGENEKYLITPKCARLSECNT